MLRLTIALALMLAPLAAAARDLRIVTPVYGQIVSLRLPEGFHGGYEAEQDGQYILELVPDGQTVEAWNQIITVTGARGMADRVGVKDFAGLLAQDYQQACPDSFASAGLPAPHLPGASAVFAAYMGCGAAEGQSEQMVVLVIAGKANLYTLQWAIHAPALSGPPDFDTAAWGPRLKHLASARLCDPVPGEAAPYPSCGG